MDQIRLKCSLSIAFIYDLLLEKNIPHESLYNRPLTVFVDWRYFIRTRNNQIFWFSDASVVSEYNKFDQQFNYSR